MKTRRVWDILNKFKDACNFHGWRTCKSEDWIKIDGEYHSFLWTREIHPSSFARIVSNRKCITHEGLSYHVVEASYTAWLFSESPPEAVIKTVFDNPEFSGRIALYDLSLVLKGEKVCVKLNNTDSPVFQEFEHFLKDELKVELKPLPLLPDAEINDSCTIEKPA
jgi:hypothetical protein